MYDIFTYIYHENQPNVGKYTIHGVLKKQLQQALEMRGNHRPHDFIDPCL